MATIPQNQEMIYLLLKVLEDDQQHLPSTMWATNQITIDAIRACVVNCYRRKPKHKAPITSDPMDQVKRVKILQTKKAHPDWTQQKIGAANNVIAGRVSEVLRGKRK